MQSFQGGSIAYQAFKWFSHFGNAVSLYLMQRDYETYVLLPAHTSNLDVAV